MAGTAFIDRGDGVRLAFAHSAGEGPMLVFLPGYMSDMSGTKALHLEAWAKRVGRACLRLDYSGCGASGGRFNDGSITRWAADARAVIDAAAPQSDLVLVGSSMGGWIMLHLALMLDERVTALVGVAAAPDFVRWGLALTPADRLALARGGAITRPSAYGQSPYRYGAGFVADGERACLLDAPIPIRCPVRLLHGSLDDAVPVGVSLRLADALESRDVRTVIVKGGDHRLSTPTDLRLLEETVACAS